MYEALLSLAALADADAREPQQHRPPHQRVRFLPVYRYVHRPSRQVGRTGPASHRRVVLRRSVGRRNDQREAESLVQQHEPRNRRTAERPSTRPTGGDRGTSCRIGMLRDRRRRMGPDLCLRRTKRFPSYRGECLVLSRTWAPYLSVGSEIARGRDWSTVCGSAEGTRGYSESAVERTQHPRALRDYINDCPSCAVKLEHAPFSTM